MRGFYASSAPLYIRDLSVWGACFSPGFPELFPIVMRTEMTTFSQAKQSAKEEIRKSRVRNTTAQERPL